MRGIEAKQREHVRLVREHHVAARSRVQVEPHSAAAGADLADARARLARALTRQIVGERAGGKPEMRANALDSAADRVGEHLYATHAVPYQLTVHCKLNQLVDVC